MRRLALGRGGNRPNVQTRAFRRAFYPEVTDRDWNDWRWQTRHRVRKLDQIEQMLVLSDDEREATHEGRIDAPGGHHAVLHELARPA